jgi:hypothetical protein
VRLDHGAFRLDDQDITIGEVLAASLAGGELTPILQEISSRHAAAGAARQRGIELGDDALQTAFDEWRGDRDLIAAEELERWLEHHDVSLDDVAAYLETRLLSDRLGEVDVELGDEGVAAERDELLGWVADEALFSGSLQALIEGFALRACAPDPATGENKRMDESRRWMLGEAGFQGEDEFLATAGIFGVDPKRARWALDRELAFRMHQQDVLTQEALRRGLAEAKDDLRRFEISTAIFRSEDVAREVVCCVREDRDSFSRAAARAGESAQRGTWYASDLDHAPFGSRLASLRERDLVGPRRLPDGRAELGQLRSASEPELSDPEVLARVERRLVDQSLRRSLQNRVHFPPTLLGAA